jgi:periplasmic mercuric ion binding protein
MKKIVLGIFLTLFTVAGKSQVMAAKPVQAILSSTNLKCWECKVRLEEYLLKENAASLNDGLMMQTLRIMPLQGRIMVKYYPDKTNLDAIRVAINNAGFDADTTRATEDAYKKLPSKCKRPEDGGGPKPKQPCHVAPIEE